MSNPIRISHPDLSDPDCRQALLARHEPYWTLLEYCRHLGYEKRSDRPAYWVARVRTSAGKYKQRRLGLADDLGECGTPYADAVSQAKAWFGKSEISRIAADAYPVGIAQDLIICPIGAEFTVGHALHDYVEWKRIAAAQSHFETNLSLINHHIILADVSH